MYKLMKGFATERDYADVELEVEMTASLGVVNAMQGL